MDLKERIVESLKDNFLSRDEASDILKRLSTTYFSPKERVDLIKFSIQQASEVADKDSYPSVFKWMKKITQVLGDFGTDELHNNAYFSHEHDIRNHVIEAISEAKKQVDICLFTISENQISDAIIQQKMNGIKIRIITDDEKIMDKGSDIFRFKHKGIPVKIDSDQSLMHHKFAVVDDRMVITGSLNWTRSGSEVNNENIVITDNYRIVSAFNDEFHRLWEQMEFL
jgi:cardiolipin hydrolase